MENTKRLLIFNEVIKKGSMSRAAESLGMTASAVSQHLQNLEAYYGLKLLNRNTRRLELTESGRILWQQASKLADVMTETHEKMTALKAKPSGMVRLSLPTGLVRTKEIRALLKTVEQNLPDIQLVLLAEDTMAQLQHSTADIAIRAGDISDSPDNVVYRLAEWSLCIAASPDYLTRTPINQPADLLTAHWLNHSDFILLNAFEALNLPKCLPEHRTECPNASASAYYLASEGMGLTFILSGELQVFAENHRLQQVLPNTTLPGKRISAVVANAAQSAKNVAVLNILKEVFRN
ncbi:LysR family transcriptional regulator [Actinobacillus succinogenes]|uniref:Transcriptional regulator, LysR family n=1 Tax=Actinobacillus succinogenes (strain ATCC 55618 / DSM 22257 / CCUG 43843 / 130Z) TaxID=339671 RepID=A6VKL9_ACTSZ|nr:LysR family transcriptional regulator [Actinobacillus succinogenes]ABR73516.1 transcriptional regulator, LysR family [Actinobacillus succinogenes 130Z]PHI40021.1 LysR family transcriptional regulator [Actinobacillus succinogenes]